MLETFVFPINHHPVLDTSRIILSRLLIHLNSRKHAHRRHRHFRRQRLIRLTQLLEIINIVTRRGREENPSLLVRGIAERVRRADGNDHVVSGFGINDLLVFAWCVGVRDVEAHGALGDKEGFVVHFVPVGWGAGGSWWHDELGDA